MKVYEKDFIYGLVASESHVHRMQQSIEETLDNFPDLEIAPVVLPNKDFSYARACNYLLRTLPRDKIRIIGGSDWVLTKLPRFIPSKLNGGVVRWMRWDEQLGEVLDRECPSSLYLWPPGVDHLYCEEFEGTFWDDFDLIHNVAKGDVYSNPYFKALHHQHPLLVDNPNGYPQVEHNKQLFIKRYCEIHGVDKVPAYIIGE
jgi:hypothetical protein